MNSIITETIRRERRRRIVRAISYLVGIVCILVGTYVFPPRASAHQYDNLSYWYCSAHRSGPEQTVVHSWPYTLAPGSITYWCKQGFFGHEWVYFVKVAPPGSNNHTRVSGYQDCDLIVCGDPHP